MMKPLVSYHPKLPTNPDNQAFSPRKTGGIASKMYLQKQESELDVSYLCHNTVPRGRWI